jgi:hypothetical protein
MGRYVYSGYQNITSGAKRIMFRVPSAIGCCSYNTTWTVPSNVSCATFEIWGGGGSGAPNCCCNCSVGHPAAAGGYSLKTISVTPGDTYTINVGAGGCGNECWWNANACGCPGGVTYVTGTGLSGFCATGGSGGYWCNSGGDGASVAGIGFGGDVNIRGRQGRSGVCCSQQCSGSAFGGAAPFGGGWQIGPRGMGGAMALSCASSGLFPGGGGTPRPQLSSWCDCCQGCAGGGADGLVIITT